MWGGWREGAGAGFIASAVGGIGLRHQAEGSAQDHGGEGGGRESFVWGMGRRVGKGGSQRRAPAQSLEHALMPGLMLG